MRWVRGATLILALGCVATQADARRSLVPVVRQISVIDAARAESIVPQRNGQAERWTIDRIPEASDGDADGLQVRWRLNKIRLRAPINFHLN